MNEYKSEYYIKGEFNDFHLGDTLVVTTENEREIVGTLTTLGPKGIYLDIPGNKNAKFINYSKIGIIEKR
ncbi:hypothetical protein DSECCO2_422590 [anaerobic digester metagenome]